MTRKLIAKVSVTYTQDEEGKIHIFTHIDGELPRKAQDELVIGAIKCKDILEEMFEFTDDL